MADAWYPLVTNPDCSACSSPTDPFQGDLGAVGLFEGAHYYHCGAYRPPVHVHHERAVGLVLQHMHAVILSLLSQY